jgi:hypothetical protein
VYDSVVVDIDLDGWPDLVAGAEGLRVRRGLGDGTFGALETYFAGTTPRGLTVVDIDLDGDLDVVACRAATGAGPKDLIVMPQKPDHSFGPLSSYSAITWPNSTAAGDLNGDGWPDVVVTSTNSGVTASQAQVRLATAPGVLGGAVTVPLGLGAGEVVLVDLNQDGFLDLAAEASQSAAVSVRLGDGAGGFGALTSFPIDSGSCSLLAVDLDQDGVLDLVVGQDDLAGEFNVLYGMGDGTFEPYVSIDSGFIYPREMAAGDIDRDGILDLAVNTGYRVSLLFGLGNRQYAAPLQHTTGSVLHSAISLYDLDLDGWLDIVVDNLWARDASVLLAEGDSTFVSADLYDGPSTFYPGIAVADFDGDGRLDVFATNEWDDTGTTWLGQGDGSFVAGPTLSVPDVAWSAEEGRLDGDDIPDLLLLDRTTGTAHVLLGQGDGSFVAGQVLATGGDWPRESALADLDHDGDLDAVIANETPRTVQVLVGGGDGTFTSGSLLGPFEGQNLRNLALGDVTGDGHDDLVVAASGGGMWRLIPGDGAGGFPTSGYLQPTGGSWMADMKLADVDGDGLLDVIQTDYNANTLLVMRNTGTAIDEYFNEPVTYSLDPTDGGPATMALADYDVDGLLDIAVGMGGAQRVDLLFGTGAGGFAKGETYAVDEAGNFIRTGDWNQDGAPDLLAVAQSISVLINRTLLNWKSLGQGLPGTDGIPWLHGEGELSAGQPVTLTLEHAAPSAPLTLVLGLSALQAPFKGGLLVPNPDLILGGLITDAAGEISLSGVWPAVPAGFSIYLQAWLIDPAGVAGLAASGATRGTDY